MKLLKTKIFGLDFWYREDDKFIGQRIALGKYEEYETMLIQRMAQDYSVFVDVGANIGYYTLLMAQKCKRVYAIEPDKECFEILKKNVEENKLENVVLLNVAAGAKKEMKNLVKDSENLGNSHLGSEKGVSVNCERLDNILINEHKIDLIKIDTQGWEPEVIEGAKKIIERDKPTMFLEYSPAEYKDDNMKKYLECVYKNIWSIDYWFYICRKGIHINKKSGYTDLWIKKSMALSDYWWTIKEIRIKKVLRGLMSYY